MKTYQLEQLNNKKNGYTPIPNSVFELMKRPFVLTDSELICFLVIYTNFTQFNAKKPYFGSFNASNKEIAYQLGWSESKVSRVISSLKEKGLIIESESGRNELVGYRAVALLTNGYSKKRNKENPLRQYINIVGAIKHCKEDITNCENVTNLADLQELDIGIYLDNWVVTGNDHEAEPP